jgi:hypothetical protein
LASAIDFIHPEQTKLLPAEPAYVLYQEEEFNDPTIDFQGTLKDQGRYDSNWTITVVW